MAVHTHGINKRIWQLSLSVNILLKNDLAHNGKFGNDFNNDDDV